MRFSATLLVQRRLRAWEYASNPKTAEEAESWLPPRCTRCPAFLLGRASASRLRGKNGLFALSSFFS